MGKTIRAKSPRVPVKQFPRRRCCFNCAGFGSRDGCSSPWADSPCHGCDPGMEVPPPPNWKKRPKDFMPDASCVTCAKDRGCLYCRRCSPGLHTHWLPTPIPPVPTADLEAGEVDPEFVVPKDIPEEKVRDPYFWNTPAPDYSLALRQIEDCGGSFNPPPIKTSKDYE